MRIVILASTAVLLAGCSLSTVDQNSEAYGLGYASGRLMRDAEPDRQFGEDETNTRCGTFRDGAHSHGMTDDAEHDIAFMEGCRGAIAGDDPPEGLKTLYGE